MVTQLKKFLDLLSSVEKKKLCILIFMILVMGFIDMLGVASIMPFIAVLANPDIIETNSLLSSFYKYLGSPREDIFLLILGSGVFFILIFSLFFKAITTFLQIKFAMMCEFTISKKFISSYVFQPYAWFLDRHSADLGKNILSETNNVVINIIMPFMVFFSQSVVAIFIFSLLLIINFKLSMIICLLLGGAYFFIYKLMSRKLNFLGQSRLEANKKRFTSVIETFGSIKEVKVGNHENLCIEKFADSAKVFAKNQTYAELIATLPRFMFEALAFGGILLVILYLILQSGSFANSIPSISLYTFAGYKLMPSLQFIYRAVSQIKFAEPSLNFLHKDFTNLNQENYENQSKIKNFDLKKNIQFENVFFNYPSSKNKVLKNISFKINVNDKIAFVGPTGSGKTTIIDLILGILSPTSGKVFIDKILLDEKNLRGWQKKIGYVPQNIYLSNDTLAANIAFGIKKEDINMEQVRKASKIANLDKFIQNELSDKYDTFAGENGIKLSGGQRQRIGIARALYNKPDILILDEATSALDTITEKCVMQSINEIKDNITVILIAHRLSTIKNSDQIFLLDNGEIKDTGTYDDLVKNNAIFQSMVT